MVEGPGCKVKGETLQKRARGQVVKGVLGNAVDRKLPQGILGKAPLSKQCHVLHQASYIIYCMALLGDDFQDGRLHNFLLLQHTKKKKKSKDEAPSPPPAPREISPYHELLDRACTEVLTLGKELFMFFEGSPTCLRVHFLMAGGFRVNGKNLDGDGGGNAQTPSLVLRMCKDVIMFNKCSAEMRPAEESRHRVMEMRHLDICSSFFSHQRAVEKLMAQQSTRIACDLLLDQELLPGVGNIIKNEALFDSRIKPDAKLSEMTKEHISFLVKMTRDFSMIFYKCRRDNKALEPYLKIYRKGKCKQCEGKAVTTRMGVDNERLTSFCPYCQDNDISKLKTGNACGKNSLLGWVTTGVVAQGPEWACPVCTYLNKCSLPACAMCTAPRPASTKPVSPALEQKNMTVTESTTSTMAVTVRQTPKRAAKRTGLSKASTTNNSNAPALLSSKFSTPLLQETPPAKRLKLSDKKPGINGVSQNSPLPSMTAVKLESSKVLVPNPSTKSVITEGIKFPSCTTHKAPCMIREVRKENQNKHRMFFSCPVRNCNFFLWADEMFPFCENHGKKCVLRTVLKNGPNNGRRFFACPQPKRSQCSTFHWADQYNNITIR